MSPLLRTIVTALLVAVPLLAHSQALPGSPGSVYALHAVDGGTIYAGTSANGVYVSGDHGQTFASAGAAGRWVWDLLTIPGAVLAAVEGGPLLVSRDGGQTFQPVHVVDGGDHGYQLAFVPSTNRVYLATWGRGVVEADAGDLTSWTPISENLPGAGPSTPAVAASPDDGNEYLDTIMVSVYGEGVWRRGGGRTHWENVGDLDGHEAFALHFTCGNFYAGTWGGGVYRFSFGTDRRYEDEGGEFEFYGLDGLHVYDFAEGPDCAVYAATNEGLWRHYTTRPAEPWEHLGFENHQLFSVTVRDDGGPCAGTSHGQVLCGLRGVSNETTPTAGARALAAPYPNPVALGAEAVMTFELAEPGNAAVVVFDLLGREVARLAEGSHAGGEHTLRWTPNGLAAGVYFVRLTTEAGHETRPIVVR